MSDDLWVADPGSEHRRRAVWGLTILGLAAVIVVSFTVFFLGTSGGEDGALPHTSDIHQTTSVPAEPTQSSRPPGTSRSKPPSSSSRPPTSPTTSPTTSSSTATTTSCSGASSCMLAGDGGKVIEAINSFRTSNGRSAVPGTTTDEAKNCSLNNGGGGCPSSYFWEPVSPQDGGAVVEKILDKGDGRSFLLDPAMKSLQVGWAFVGGQFSCTIVAVT